MRVARDLACARQRIRREFVRTDGQADPSVIESQSMPRNWTENQRVAIETLDRDVCVAAGAGSGKTGVLVERFLRIVRESLCGSLAPELRAGVGEILVITFTEKATREMKE